MRHFHLNEKYVVYRVAKSGKIVASRLLHIKLFPTSGAQISFFMYIGQIKSGAFQFVCRSHSSVDQHYVDIEHFQMVSTTSLENVDSFYG